MSVVDPAAVARCVAAGEGADVDVTVGGAFGSGLRPQYPVFLAVLAARLALLRVAAVGERDVGREEPHRLAHAREQRRAHDVHRRVAPGPDPER